MQYSSNYRLKLMDGTDPVKRQDFVLMELGQDGRKFIHQLINQINQT